MSGPRTPGFDTLALHAGSAPDRASGAGAGHPLASSAHPANALLEERIAALEGGVAGIAAASGQAAMHLGLATLVGAGEHIVASRALGGGAHHLLAHALRRFGVDTTFVDPRDPAAWRAAIRPSTRLLFGEALGEGGLDVLDIPAIAQLAHEHDLPLMVDASLATPSLQRPFDLGADLLFHSASAFLCGHGSAAGGVLVDGGTFDWQAAHARSGRFATLCEPAPGCNGMVYSEESTVGAFALHARGEGLRDFGAALDPHAAHAILHGVETLGLRMERHVATTRRVVDFLLSHPLVASVAYPELASHPDHQLAQRILPRGCGAGVSVELTGGDAAGRRFVAGLRVFSRLADGGRARSLAVHPASSTHWRAPAGQLAAGGVGEGTLHLSIGLEEADDLIDDLKRGLKLAGKGA